MDESTIKDAIEECFNAFKENIFRYVCYSMIAILLFGWIWSLLFDLLNKGNGNVSPWTAFFLFLDPSQNTKKENIFLWLSLMVPIGFLGLLVISHLKTKYIQSIYGNTHWATMPEIKKMGLLECKAGLIIGDKYGKLLRAPLISHALIFAPSRSGKGVSQVLPNALAFSDSMLLIDVKDEIFEATSGFRQAHGQEVYSFAPMRKNRCTHRWNPLDFISKNSEWTVADVDLVCTTLIRPAGEKDDLWVGEARALLKGLLLLLMHQDNSLNIGTLVNFVKGTPDFSGELTKMRDEAINSDGTINMHPTAFININNFLNKAEKEQSGVKSTLTLRLNLWDDPLIQAATETSDFDIRDMRRKKMTVYLGIPLGQLDRLSPLMNLFVQLFLNCMTQELPQQDEPYKVLAMLDEFCALGRMDILKNGFGFLAGFNVHLMAVIQNVGQFYDTYGGRDKSDVFFQNTDYKIAYRQNDKTDREFVSEMCGMRAVKNRTQSYQTGFSGQGRTGASESYISKPLISSDQVGRFSEKHGIAIFNGQQPIKYRRIIYYNDERFKSRVLPPIKILALSTGHQPLKVNKPVEKIEETSSVQLLAEKQRMNEIVKARIDKESEVSQLVDEDIEI